MGKLWQNFKQFLSGDDSLGLQPTPLTRTRTIQLPPEQRLPRTTRTYHEVQLEPKPYWQSMGWTQHGDEYRGSYQAGGESFPGRIERLYADTWDFFIQIEQPWPALIHHHKWPCFAVAGDRGWRKVHWKIKPTSLDSGIQSIERTLAQAL